MARLKEPLELLDPGEGEEVSFRVLRWELGEGTITNKREGVPKDITILRVHVPTEDKRTGVSYWDISGKNLRVQLVEHLPSIVSMKRRVKVVKHGFGPAARYSLDIS